MIHVFRAKDGRWNVAPASVANWPRFREAGIYQSREQAEAMARQLHPGCTVRVERRFFW